MRKFFAAIFGNKPVSTVAPANVESPAANVEVQLPEAPRYWIQFAKESREQAYAAHPEGYGDIGVEGEEDFVSGIELAISDAVVAGPFNIIDREGNVVFGLPKGMPFEVVSSDSK